MRYIPHTPAEIDAMLSTVGVADLEELFQAIPASIRLKTPLNLPAPMAEPELLSHLEKISASNPAAEFDSYLGGGAYKHHVPAAVDALLMRGEFFTAYTPYQAEISQGTLQATFEFQTMIARLFGMEVACASLYDGASAVAEAVLMARRVTRKSRVLVASSLNPSHIQVLKTYLQFHDPEFVFLPTGPDGRVDLEFLASQSPEEAAAVVVQSPNFFGVIEDLSAVKAVIGDKVRFVVTFTEPLAYALIKSPGECGADIIAGEGAGFGIPISFGGPFLGLFAARKSQVRSMPGRLVGETEDAQGRRAYVLTLSTREQHIRREKATSNICTNQALCALACVIYLALHGRIGLARLARVNLDLAEYAKERLLAAGARRRFSSPTFNEFVLDFPQGARRVLEACREERILPGLAMAEHLEGGEDALLICATELNTKEGIDRLAALVAGL